MRGSDGEGWSPEYRAVRAALPAAAQVHFAGHGVLAPRDPWAAHLALADGPLGLPEILTTPVRARLVVLSGCETGADSVLLDEGAVGLAEAFLAAGAASVLATDRPVADASAARFMAAFHDAGGADRPAEAARVAAAFLRTKGDPHWSAFRVIGHR